jgi:hypothetical protein
VLEYVLLGINQMVKATVSQVSRTVQVDVLSVKIRHTAINAVLTSLDSYILKSIQLNVLLNAQVYAM